jgi:hypothetical protein
MADAAPTIRLPGLIDIVTANDDGSSATVLLGEGGGAFAPPVNYPTGLQPTSVAVGDVNGDGFPDIVVSSGGNPYGGVGDNTVTVLLGNGSGGFKPASGSPITIGTGVVRPYGVAVADINGDGFADIVTANYGNSTLSILKSNGNGTFQPPVTVTLPAGANPGFLKLADVNGDGKPDIIESNFGTGTVGVLLNDGHGGFSAPTYTNVGSGPAGLAVGDINGDGFPDIVVGNTGDNTVSVLLNDRHGGFTAQTPVTLASGAIPLNVALGDLNGDGKLDMVVDDIQDDTIVVLLGDGAGHFTQKSSFTFGSGGTGTVSTSPQSVSLVDINGDGILDIVTSAYQSGVSTVVVFLGNGDGTFHNPTEITAGNNALSMAVASFEPLTVIENTSLVFSSANGNAITVADADGGSSSETVTLSVAHGTLTLGSTTGLTGLTGNGGPSLSFNGTIAQLNAALNGLTYTPTAQYHGADAVAVTINDNTGSQPTTLSSQTLSVLAVNHAPAGTDNTITTLEDTAHTFTISDFGFTDPNDSPANSLLAVEITTLPTAGTLKDNGVAVTAGQFVSATDINAGHLVFTPAADVNGTGYAHFTFQVEDDGGTANGGVNLDQSANTIAFNVTPVNDAPVASGTAALALPNTVAALFSSHFDDSADNQPSLPGGSTANTLAGIAVTGDAANASTQGSWQYSTDGGGSWTNIATGVSATSALILSDTAELRFSAVAGFGGAPGALTAHVIDSSAGNVSTTGVTGAALQGSSSSFTGIDVASHDGGSTPVSTGTVSLTAVVPAVTSINLAGSTSNNGSSEAFTVTFSENVTGVDNTDFTAVAGNTVVDTSISVSAVSASVYTVTINGVSGDGSLGLNLNASGTGIADAAGTAVSGGFTGQVYTIDHTAPTVSSIAPAGVNPNFGGNEQFTVNFSESVTGVDSSDFTAVTGGTADTGITVTPVSGSVYTVTVDGVTGTGTLGLNLNASGTGIADLAGNAISGGFTGSTYTITPPPPPPLDNVMLHPTLTVTLDRVGVDPDNTVFTAQNVVGIVGGGSAVEWLDPTANSHAGYIEFLSPTGDVTANVSLSGSNFPQLPTGGSQLAALSNGDVVLTYTGANGSTYFSVIAPTGVVVAPTTPVTTSSSGGQSTQLSNIEFAVASVVSDAVQQTSTLQINFYSTQAGSVGSPVGTPVSISNAQLLGNGSLVGNDLGSFAVVYNSTADNQAHVAFYANTGTSPAATIALGASALAQTVALSNGDFAVLTSDINYANFKLQIYTSSGATVGNPISLPAINGDIFLAADLTPGEQGVTVYNDYNANVNANTGSVYAIRFDNAGNIVAGGTQSSQGNITSIENSGNGVEVYNGHGNYFIAGAAQGHSAGEVNLYLNQSNNASAPVLQTFELAAPTVTSVTAPANGTYGAGQALTFTVNFSEKVQVTGTPFIDVTLDTGGTVHAVYTGGSGTSGLTFAYTVVSGNGDANGVAIGSAINLNGGTIEDAAAIGAALTLNSVASTTGVLVDAIPPTVSSIHTVEASPNNLSVEHFTVTFSAPVNGVDASDFTLVGTGTASGAIGSVSGSGTTWTVTLNSVSGTGTLRLDLNNAGDPITDNFGNRLTAAHTGDQSYTIDHTAPIVTVTTNENAVNASSAPATITFTFSENVSGFLASDITAQGGVVSGLTHSGSNPDVYTATFTPSAGFTGTGSVSVTAGSYTDVAGNIGGAGTATFSEDTQAPIVTVTTNENAVNSSSVPATITFTFSENVSGFLAGDITAQGGVIGALTHSGSNPDVYTATFTPNAGFSGTGSVSVTAGSYTDVAGNAGAGGTATFSEDTLAPTVSVAADHTALLAGRTAAVTFTFSEAVAGFVLGDTSVSGGALSHLIHVGLNGSNQDIYTATFTPNATNTEIGSVQVNASSYADVAGNNGAVSNTVNFTGDTLAPTATATASPSSGTEIIGDPVQITLAFGEAVTIAGSAPALALNDGGTATYDPVATAALHDATKLVFDYTVGPHDANTATLAVTGVTPGTSIADLAGNAAGVAATLTGLAVLTSLVTANPDTNHVGAGQTISVDAAHGVLANDTDTNPTDHVVVSAVNGLSADVNQPIAGTYGTLTLHDNGSYSYSASGAVSGVVFDNFTYTDSNGHGPPSTSTLTVEVVGANQNFVFVPSGGSATGGYGNTVLDGSAGNATLTAATTFNAHQILIGGPGDVLNAASYGQDTFVFANNFGHETINNFHPALDVIQLQQSQFGSLANALADIHQVGADSVLTLDPNHVITITNTQHSSLTAADFHLV